MVPMMKIAPGEMAFSRLTAPRAPVMGAVHRPAWAEWSLHLWSLPTSSDRPSTPPPDPHLTERCNSPICVDVFSVSENSWVKFEIDCLKASVSAGLLVDALETNIWSIGSL